MAREATATATATPATKAKATLAARVACPAGGKLNPAGRETTREAQLTETAFAAPPTSSSPLRPESLPPDDHCPARGKLNPAGRETTLEAQLTKTVFAAPPTSSSPLRPESLPPGDHCPTRGKPNSAGRTNPPEAQLTKTALSTKTPFPAPRMSDRVADEPVEGPAKHSKRVAGVAVSDVGRKDNNQNRPCTGPAKRQAQPRGCRNHAGSAANRLRRAPKHLLRSKRHRDSDGLELAAWRHKAVTCHKPVTQHETSSTGAPATHQPLHSTNRPAAQSAGRKG
jgi:hypothetical protein